MERLIKSRIAHENGDVEYTVDVGKITVNRHGDGFMRRVLDKLWEYEQAEAQEQRRWISVDEKLPEAFVPVLVQIRKDPFPAVRKGFVTDDGIWHGTGFARKPGEVTHWKPMPEPTQEGQQ